MLSCVHAIRAASETAAMQLQLPTPFGGTFCLSSLVVHCAYPIWWSSLFTPFRGPFCLPQRARRSAASSTHSLATVKALCFCAQSTLCITVSCQVRGTQQPLGNLQGNSLFECVSSQPAVDILGCRNVLIALPKKITPVWRNAGMDHPILPKSRALEHPCLVNSG